MDDFVPVNAIEQASFREVAELEDALIADDDAGKAGSGEVLWVSPERPLYRVIKYLKEIQ